LQCSHSYPNSGSAFPATLAFQIRELERETANDLKLDAIVTVIDAENFTGYEDTSPTAKMQASYTDMILIVDCSSDLAFHASANAGFTQNKWEHVSDRHLDLVIDHLNTLNDLTPKIRCRGRNGIDPNVIFGVESKLFHDGQHVYSQITTSHNDEVETVLVYKGPKTLDSHNSVPNGDHSCGTVGAVVVNSELRETVDEHVLSTALGSLSKENVWRVKGFVRFASGLHILNWAFGRFELRKLQDDKNHLGELVRLTIMGERGEVKRMACKLAAALEAGIIA
jgi:G3E family GTPase